MGSEIMTRSFPFSRIGRTEEILHTIIICTSRSIDTVSETLSCLRNFLTYPRVSEILVVTNRGVQQHEEIKNYASFLFGESSVSWKVVHEKVAGLSSARNRGLSLARGEIITFLDDDASIESSDWQHSILRVFDEHTDVGIVGGRADLMPPPGKSGDAWWRSEQTDLLLSCNTHYKGDGYWPAKSLFGVNISYRNIALNGLQFDLRLGWNMNNKRAIGGEEVVFNNSIVSRGWKSWYEPKAGVYHRVGLERYNLKWLLNRAYVGGLTNGYLNRSSRMKLLVNALNGGIISIIKCAAQIILGRPNKAFANVLRLLSHLGCAIATVGRTGRAAV